VLLCLFGGRSECREQFPRSIFVASSWQMSRRCRQHVTRKSGVSDVSDDDAARMLATCPQQVVRVGLVEFGERHGTRTNGLHYTPQQTAGQPITQVRGKLTVKLPDTRDILVASSRLCRACLRGCCKETASVEFELNHV